MKRVLNLVLLFAVAAGGVYARDMGIGAEASGLRVPYYDDQDQLKAQFYGEHFKVLDTGEVEVTNLKIEMYQNGEVVMTVFSPHCFFNRETMQAHSEGRVLIESGLMTLVGRGFTWSAEAGRFEVLHDSKVLVKKAAKTEAQELDL